MILSLKGKVARRRNKELNSFQNSHKGEFFGIIGSMKNISPVFFLAVFLLVPIAVFAQQSAGIVTLPDTATKFPAGTTDTGPLNSNQIFPYLGLATKVNSAVLSQEINELYDPSSPNYRKFLTPLQVANLAYLSIDDYNKVILWLQSENLTVNDALATSTTKRSFLISFGGTVQQIDNAFHITLHAYSCQNGLKTFGTPDNISFPADIAPLITDSGIPLELGDCSMPVPATSIGIGGVPGMITLTNLTSLIIPILKFNNPSLSIIVILSLLLVIYFIFLIIRFVIWIIKKLFTKKKNDINNLNLE